MDWNGYKEKLKNADNESLLRALVEQAKKMDDELAGYKAVKLIKTELLNRLEGEVFEEKGWREELTEQELEFVLQQYKQRLDISAISNQLDEEVTQKAVLSAVAKVYGIDLECDDCGITKHIAYAIGSVMFCIECGNIQKVEGGLR